MSAPPIAEKSPYSKGEIVAEKYVLVRPLGEGGMGEVWVAHNRALDVDVAIKFISPVAESEEQKKTLAERLLREARSTAKLQHPAIVKVFDFGKTYLGDPMIVMELLEGEDLGSVLRDKESLSPVRAVRTLLPIAHALATAHEKDIVHRDLKPENIFLAKEDGRTQPKVLDFGIAKGPASRSHRLTQDGSLIGSPEYMSPEQAYGDDTSFPADIWSYSIVLYELIAGRLPFEGKNYNTTLRSITHDEPTPLTQGEGVEALWKIIARGLAKDPTKRWNSMREMGLRLALWLQEQGVNDDLSGSAIEAAWLEPAGLATGFSSIAPPPPSGDPTSTGRRVAASGVRPAAGSHPDAPSQTGQDLERIADLHQGGDPVRMMQLESRRRTIWIAVVFAVLIIGATAAILIGTGIVER